MLSKSIISHRSTQDLEELHKKITGKVKALETSQNIFTGTKFLFQYQPSLARSMSSMQNEDERVLNMMSNQELISALEQFKHISYSHVIVEEHDRATSYKITTQIPFNLDTTQESVTNFFYTAHQAKLINQIETLSQLNTKLEALVPELKNHLQNTFLQRQSLLSQASKNIKINTYLYSSCSLAAFTGYFWVLLLTHDKENYDELNRPLAVILAFAVTASMFKLLYQKHMQDQTTAINKHMDEACSILFTEDNTNENTLLMDRV